MRAQLSDWLHQRTRFRDLRDALLLEHIPGGARWRYVWGSTLVFVFTLQLVTGVLLMTAYSPGESSAWGSVYFIQYQMDFGWLIRGLHHFGSQTMVVLLGLHMLQVVIAGAHLPPREINWWLGLGLLSLVLGLALTGYLLPWDQKGLWATQVATSIAGNLPLIGPWLQRVIVGGPEYGNHTLTRFYALHVGVLPPLVILLTVAHVAVFRRHGVTVPRMVTGTAVFWPAQAFRDMLICLLIFGVMLAIVVVGHGHDAGTPPADQGHYESLAHAGQRGLGANLDAPADLAKPYPARPEWYFLFLFQLLKYFEGEQVLIGTVVIPTAVGLLLFLLPLLGIGRLRPFGRVFGVLVVVGLLAGAAALTCLALAGDSGDPVDRAVLEWIAKLVVPVIAGVLLLHLALRWLLPAGRVRRIVSGAGVIVLVLLGVSAGGLLYASLSDREIPPSLEAIVKKHMTDAERKVPQETVTFLKQRDRADEDAARAILLAGPGIPEEGAKYLLRRDPLTQGPGLFKEHCAKCHRYSNHQGQEEFPADAKGAWASDLGGYGSYAWIRGLLRNPQDARYFGHTKLTGMIRWADDLRDKREEMSPAEQKKLDDNLDLVAQWLATHPRGKPSDAKADDLFTRGYNAFHEKRDRGGCISCHAYGEKEGKAPDLTGYGSAEWVRFMLLSPAHPTRHGKKNAMPAFWSDVGLGTRLQPEEFKANPDVHVLPLSELDRELIIRWLVGDFVSKKGV
jgi:ubiquinol-cytochrome c reductase cytochrome b subunit